MKRKYENRKDKQINQQQEEQRKRFEFVLLSLFCFVYSVLDDCR
jgi:hypothetical protein